MGPQGGRARSSSWHRRTRSAIRRRRRPSATQGSQQGRGVGNELLARTLEHARKAGAINKGLITFTFNVVSQVGAEQIDWQPRQHSMPDIQWDERGAQSVALLTSLQFCKIEAAAWVSRCP